MRKLKKLMDSPKAAAAVFAAAAGLLLFSTVGGARAAVLYGAQNYPATIRTSAISVALVEENEGTKERRIQTEEGSDQTLLSGLVPAGEKIRPGRKYGEILSVENTGETEEYVRVTVYRYWTKRASSEGEEKAEKDRTVSPAYIRLHFPEEGWEIDGEASTEERTMLYYKYPLKAGERAVFVEGLTIDSAVAGIRERTEGEKTSYRYEDLAFEVKVSVDAVQTHHAEEAILSAWGRQVSVDEKGVLTLRENGEKEKEENPGQGEEGGSK